MSNHQAQFSPSQRLKSVASSEPFTVFRNRERHNIGTYYDDIISGSVGVCLKRQVALHQAKLYNSSLSDHNIPIFLLKDYMFQEELKHQHENTNRSHMHHHMKMLSDEPSLSQSTLAHCNHRDQNYIVHTAGRCMDHLVIRSPSYFKPHNDLEEPGFTLSLGKGSPLLETLSIGTSAWHSSSHFLSRTSTELFHVRTVTLSDHVPGEDFATRKEIRKWKDNKNKLPDDFCLLEPLQKWTLPCEIVHLAAPPNNNLSYAVALSDTGRLYHWTPSRGFGMSHGTVKGEGKHANAQQSQYQDINHIIHKQNDADSINDSAVQKEMWRLFSHLECSTHPMLCHVSYRKEFFTIDFRTRLSATLLSQSSSSPSSSTKNSNQLFSTPSLISSIRQSPDSQHDIYVCSKGSVAAMDLRYPKLPVCQRHVPDTHSITKIARGNTFSSTCLSSSSASNSTYNVTREYDHVNSGHCGDILIGSSKHSSQVFIHAMERPGVNHEKSLSYSTRNIISAGVESDCNNRAAASLFFGSGPLNSSQSVFWDTHAYPVVDHRAGGQGVSLCGLELVPCRQKSISSRDTRDNDNDNSNDDNNNSNDNDDDDDDKGNKKKRVKFKLNGKVNHNKNELEDKRPTRNIHGRYNALLLQQSSLGDVFVQPIVIGMERRPTTSIRSADVTSRRGKKSSESEKHKAGLNDDSHSDEVTAVITTTITSSSTSSSSSVSVIQMNAPIGIVAPYTASTIVTTPLEFIKKKKSFAGPFCGTSLGLNLSKFDKVVHTYPVSSSVFLPYVDRSSIRRFDILTVDPSRIYIERTLSITSLLSDVSTLLMPRILDRLYLYPHSLWELWRALNLHVHVARDPQSPHTNPYRFQAFRQVICRDARIVESIENGMIRFKRPPSVSKSTINSNSTNSDQNETVSVKKKGRGRKPKKRENANDIIPSTTIYSASINSAAAVTDNENTFDGLYVQYADTIIDRTSCQCATGTTLCSTDYNGPCRYTTCLLPHVLLYTLNPDYIKTHPPPLLSSFNKTRKRRRRKKVAVMETLPPNHSILNPEIRSQQDLQDIQKRLLQSGTQSASQRSLSQPQFSQSSQQSVNDDDDRLNNFIVTQSQSSLNPISNSSNSIRHNDGTYENDGGDEQSAADGAASVISALAQQIIKKKRRRRGLSSYISREYDGDQGGGYSSGYSQQSTSTSGQYSQYSMSQAADSSTGGGYESVGTIGSSFTSHSHSQYQRDRRRPGQLVTSEIITQLMQSWDIED